APRWSTGGRTDRNDSGREAPPSRSRSDARARSGRPRPFRRVGSQLRRSQRSNKRLGTPNLDLKTIRIDPELEPFFSAPGREGRRDAYHRRDRSPQKEDLRPSGAVEGPEGGRDRVAGAI